MSAAAAAAPISLPFIGSSFYHRLLAEEEARKAAEEGIARNYVARLKNDVEVEILSQEAYAALTPFERSVEGSCSSEQTGTFRTLAALGFKHDEVKAYLEAPNTKGVGSHLDIFKVAHFHSRVTFALQRFNLLPLQRSNAAPPL